MMFVLPPPVATAVTVPLDATVATAVLLLDQAPVPPPKVTPDTVYAAVVPGHSGVVPLTVPATALGVTVSALDAVLVPVQPPVIV